MIYRFDSFEVDTEQRELRQHGRAVPIQPKTFALLEYLIERADRLVTKTELLDAFWSVNAAEASLLTTISQVRKALGKTGKGNAVIKTYHGQGFRFVAPLEDAAAAPQAEHLLNMREQRIVAVLGVRFICADENAAQDFIATARAELDAHQGQLMRMMVDEFTAAFGLEQACEDSARRALYCATSLLQHHPGLHLSFGIAAGPIALEDQESEWTPPTSLNATRPASRKLQARGT